MPKMKTKKAVAKRFRKTGTGKLKYAKCGASHLLTGKSRKRKRNLRKPGVITGAAAKRIGLLF